MFLANNLPRTMQRKGKDPNSRYTSLVIKSTCTGLYQPINTQYGLTNLKSGTTLRKMQLRLFDICTARDCTVGIYLKRPLPGHDH